MAKVSAYYSYHFSDAQLAVEYARTVLASNQIVFGDRVMLDEEVGMELVGPGSDDKFEFACKLVCEGPVDLGRLMGIGFDFEVLG